MFERFIKYSLRFCMGGVAVGLLWGLGLAFFIYLIPFSLQEILEPTDGIVVFTGGKTRLQTALSLFQQKKSKHLLISGVNRDATFRDVVGETPFVYVTLGYQAQDTFGNAEETAAWVKAHQIKTLRLITSNYHMPRSLLELRRYLPDIRIIPHAIIREKFWTPHWWRHFPILTLVIQEYNKFLFALLRHFFEDIHKVLKK